MACQEVKAHNRFHKGRTGRLTYARRRSRGIPQKKCKTRLPDGTWDAPQGVPRSP